jgi:hypothetical protein
VAFDPLDAGDFSCTSVGTVRREHLTDFDLMLRLAIRRVGEGAYGVARQTASISCLRERGARLSQVGAE